MSKKLVLNLLLCTAIFNGCSCSMDNTNKTVTTTSGLKYTTIKEGTGAQPKKGQRVTVHYTGWLEKNGERGQQFDSSLDRKQPFTFVAGGNQVIKGWDEGVMLMKVGGKYRLIIPSDLGYGPRGFPGAIPGGATLIFDIELLSVE